MEEIKRSIPTKQLDVTVILPTRDRYFTTLPLTIASIATQVWKPKRLIIYDDGEKIDLRQYQTYQYLFQLLDHSGIKWEVKFGENLGQAVLHDRGIRDSETEFIWRIDDDCVAEPTVLMELYNLLTDATYAKTTGNKLGAVGGIVAEPGKLTILPKILNGSMDDVMLGQNVQWYAFGRIMGVTHLYSSFLYRKAAAAHGYRTDLSRASHREETIFSHQMYVNGWYMLVTPAALTWHFRNKEGGIRTAPGQDFAHDENIFRKIMAEDWKETGETPFIAVLDNGIGDHYAFKQMLPDLMKKYEGKRMILSCCYPEIFDDVKGIEIISIRDASIVLGDLGRHNIYGYMSRMQWEKTGKNLVEAFKSMYGV